MDWFYAHHNEQRGPVSEQEFRDLVTRGVVTAETLVWNETLPEWRPYGNVSDPTVASASPSYSATLQHPVGHVQCTQCKNFFPEEDTIAYKEVRVCARCKPFFFQSLREGVAVPGEFRYAGFWIRALAKLLDGLIFGIPMGLFFLVYFLLIAASFEEGIESMMNISVGWQIFFQLIGFPLNIVIEGFFVSRYAGTPGKWICGIKVIRTNGDPVSFARGCGRGAGEIISYYMCYIGFIIAAFDQQKRALHDYMCDTRVVYK